MSRRKKLTAAQIAIWCIFIPFVIFFSYLEAFGDTYYVSTTGNDGYSGTESDSAWNTLGYSVSQLTPGDTLIIMGGTWNNVTDTVSFGGVDHSVTLHVNVSGTLADPIVIKGTAEWGKPTKSRGCEMVSCKM